MESQPQNPEYYSGLILKTQEKIHDKGQAMRKLGVMAFGPGLYMHAQLSCGIRSQIKLSSDMISNNVTF